MPSRVWLNGRIVPSAEATISALSPGFLYGIGAFETMRWYRGRGVFRLDAHLRRLSRALDLFGLPQIALEGVEAAIAETVHANAPSDDVTARLIVAAGERNAPIRLIHLRPITQADQRRASGASATVATDGRGELARHKSLNYASCWLAKRDASNAGYDEALLRDDLGFLREGATTNLFLFRDGELLTPALNRPLLPGVTRGVILELAARHRMQARETDVTQRALEGASEAFLTNSVAGVLPLTRFNDLAIGEGVVGARTAELRRAYERLIQDELGDTT